MSVSHFINSLSCAGVGSHERERRCLFDVAYDLLQGFWVVLDDNAV